MGSTGALCMRWGQGALEVTLRESVGALHQHDGHAERVPTGDM